MDGRGFRRLAGGASDAAGPGLAPGHARSLLRDLPQPAPQDRRCGVRVHRSRAVVGQRRHLGEDHPQAARGHDAAAGRAAAGRRGGAGAGVVAGNVARRRSGRRPQSGPRAAAPAEPRGVRQRGRRPARHSRGCRRAPAEGRRGQWLRQHRGRAARVAVVPGPVRDRRKAGDTARARQPERQTDHRHLPAGTWHRSDEACRGIASRHARRAERRTLVPVGRRLQVQHQRPGRRLLHPRHGVPAHAGRDHRRPQGVRRVDRRRGRHAGDRSEAGAGGRRDQRPVPEHRRAGEGGAAQGGRDVRGTLLRGIRRGAVFAQARRARGSDSPRRRPGDYRPVRAHRDRQHAEPRAHLRLPPGPVG